MDYSGNPLHKKYIACGKRSSQVWIMDDPKAVYSYPSDCDVSGCREWLCSNSFYQPNLCRDCMIRYGLLW